MKLLDRYILRRFFQYLIFALIASAVIFITVDSTEHLDKFIDAHVPYHLVLRYYYLYLPYIIYLTLPVSVLLATLFTIGGFVYRNELTAMQSAGYSLWRILGMLVLLAIPLSMATLVFGESVVPVANHERKTLYREHVTKQKNPVTSRRGRLYIQVGQNEYLKMEGYDPENRIGERISLHTLYRGRLLKRVTAERMRFEENAWLLTDAETYAFAQDKVTVTRLDTLRRADFTITPDDLSRVNIAPEEMNYVELRDMVRRLKASGVRAGKWVVDLAFKISQPFATVIIVLFGVPFAAIRRRGGLVFGFGLSLLVCFVFFGFMQVGKILGYNGSVGPIMAAWAGNIVFGVLGVALVIRVRK
ncbi:LPS export ABC transporter permease LptG [bacterium]|nr:LPS export ABC transporter permease LptG [bacterium]MBU1984615.1 LPS export ABC transporter permease LptG [bacterium]